MFPIKWLFTSLVSNSFQSHLSTGLSWSIKLEQYTPPPLEEVKAAKWVAFNWVSLSLSWFTSVQQNTTEHFPTQEISLSAVGYLCDMSDWWLIFCVTEQCLRPIVTLEKALNYIPASPHTTSVTTANTVSILPLFMDHRAQEASDGEMYSFKNIHTNKSEK